jgi:hypothetical protein
VRRVPGHRGRPGRRAVIALGAVAFAASGFPAPAAAVAVAVERSSPAGMATEVPPDLTTTATGEEALGLLLTSPASLELGTTVAIHDNAGDLVWWGAGTNLSQVTYRGEPALCVYRSDGQGGSEYVLLDSSYTEVASFAMAGGYATDMHDIAFSPDGSRVLLLSYHQVDYDLSEYGGPADAVVMDVVVQEQDVTTGEVTFEWRGLDHVPVDETQEPLTTDLVDYMHANSLAYDADGGLLMSGRNTSTVYRIDLDSGDIVWRFGGENSDFAFADPADMPSYQHDARWQSDGSLSVFDNGNAHSPPSSRGAVYDLDEETMTATLVADLRPEEDLFARALGSAREMANGNRLVSYGGSGLIVEFDGTEPVFTGTFPEGVITYRAERSPGWQGTPAAPPDVVWSEPRADGGREVRVSWNGATEVDRWRVEIGGEAVATVDRSGFETVVEVPPGADGAEGAEGAWRISALDDAGKVLGSSSGQWGSGPGWVPPDGGTGPGPVTRFIRARGRARSELERPRVLR